VSPCHEGDEEVKTSRLTMVLLAILALTMIVGCDGFFSIQPEPVKGAAGEYEPIAFPAEAQMKVVLADQTGNPIPPPEFPIGVKYTVPDQSRSRSADTQFAGEDQTAPFVLSLTP
jgi:hypothetical protein